MVEVPVYFQKRLKPDEEVVDFIRPFGLVYFWWFFLSFVLIFGSLYYFFYLYNLGFIGIAIFICVFFLGCLALAKTMVVWRLTAFIVTTQRVIDFDQHGFFVRQISETSFANIQDITMEQKGFWATVLKFGTIKIQTASSQNVIEFQHVRYPRDVHENIMEYYSQGKSDVASQMTSDDWRNDPKLRSFFEVIEKTKAEVGEDKFQEALKEWLKE